MSSCGALRLAEVDRDEPLVAVDERPPQRDAVLLPAQRPQGVAARVLDLDDVGPEVGEQRPDDRPREEHAGVDDAQSLERTGRLGRSVPGAFPPRARSHPPHAGSAPRRWNTNKRLSILLAVVVGEGARGLDELDADAVGVDHVDGPTALVRPDRRASPAATRTPRPRATRSA